MSETEMTFLKIFSDMEVFFTPYSFEEKGKLFDAMMKYTFHGEDTEFEGNERFIWAVLKNHIDACAEKSRKNAENGAKGGRPPKPTESEENPEKAKESEQKRTKPKRTQQKPIQEQEHIHKQEHIHINDDDASSRTHTHTREENGTLSSVDQIIGIEKTEQDDPRQQAEQLVKRFGLPQVDDVIETVANDIETNGLCDVQAAFLKAATSDKHGGISLNYYKTILANKDLPPPQKHNGQKDPVEEMRRKEWLEQSDF